MYNDCLTPLYVRVPNSKEHLRVRCGKCINCMIHRTSEWSIRLFMESHYWQNISHLTLTYTDDELPVMYTTEENLFYCYESEEQDKRDIQSDKVICIPTLYPRDLCLFIKRLRKSGAGEYHRFSRTEYDEDTGKFVRLDSGCRVGFKYYGVGEYGTLRGRSHLHVVLFGVPATPEWQYKISKIWGKGRICLKSVFPETFGYVAGYVQKKLYGDKQNPFRFPEFMRCSQRLGFDWIYDHLDIFDDEHCYIPFQGKNGKSFKFGVPRYFRDFLVESGRIRKVSALALVEQQKLELVSLRESLNAKGISEADFFRQRYKDCKTKFIKKQFRRNQTGDI